MQDGTDGRNISYDIAVKAGTLRLQAEARLGELIRQDQDAGRLATQGIDKDDKFKGNTVVTLKDYGLTKMDSSRAQGGRPPENQLHHATGFTKPPSYADLGIEKMQSYRWQLGIRNTRREV